MFTAFITVKVENQFKRLTYFQNETPSFLAFKAALIADNPAAKAMNELLQEYQQKFFPKCLTVNIVHAFATRLKKPLKGAGSSLTEADFDLFLLNILKSKGFKLEFDYFVRFVSEFPNISFIERFFPYEYHLIAENKNKTFDFFNFIELYKFLQSIKNTTNTVSINQFYSLFVEAKQAYQKHTSIKDIQTALESEIQAKTAEFDKAIKQTVERLIELEKSKITTIKQLETNKIEHLNNFTKIQKKYKEIFE